MAFFFVFPWSLPTVDLPLVGDLSPGREKERNLCISRASTGRYRVGLGVLYEGPTVSSPSVKGPSTQSVEFKF